MRNLLSADSAVMLPNLAEISVCPTLETKDVYRIKKQALRTVSWSELCQEYKALPYQAGKTMLTYKKQGGFLSLLSINFVHINFLDTLSVLRYNRAS